MNYAKIFFFNNTKNANILEHTLIKIETCRIQQCTMPTKIGDILFRTNVTPNIGDKQSHKSSNNSHVAYLSEETSTVFQLQGGPKKLAQ